MSHKTPQKPRGMAGKVSKAVQDLRQQRAKCVDGSSEAVRLDELIALAGGSGEPIEDKAKTALQGDRRKPEKRPKLF